MTPPAPDFQNALTFAPLRDNAIGSLQIGASWIARSKNAARFARFVNKRLYPLGLGAALNRYDASLTFYASRADHRLYAGFAADAVFVNLGSGAFHHPRWTNYDYPGLSDYYKAIQGVEGRDFHAIDLCVDDLALPFDANSVALIYCSHTLEHLETEKAVALLKECARVLAPNGALRLALPDTRRDFDHARVVSAQPIDPAHQAASRRSAARLLLSATEAFDDATIEALMREAGFDTQAYVERALRDHTGVDRFEPSNPERHISHWRHDNLAALAAPSGFRAYLPTLRGASTQAPFRNLAVFDNTETHIAFYGEFVAQES